MRVLLITTSYPLNSTSSSGVFVARLAKYLKQLYAVMVLVPGDLNVTPKKRIIIDEIQISPFQYAPRYWQRLSHSSGGIPVALKRNPFLYFLVPGLLISMFFNILWEGRKFDVLHANWAVCGLVAGAAGKIIGVPVVVSLRGEDMTRGTQKFIDRLILKGCLVLCDRVVGVSSAIVERLQHICPQYWEKYILVENGVDEYFLSLERSYRVGDKLSLIAIGSLIPRKGMDVVINAVAAVPGTKLVIFGDGPERRMLQQLIGHLGVSDRVELAGWIEPNSVRDQLSRCDVLVLSSYSEGRPNVVLEAMATAMPVIASNIAGVSELVEHGQTGMLFPAGNSEMLADLLNQLKGDTEQIRIMGEKSRQKIISKKLVWGQTAAKYGKIYNKVTRGEG